MPIYEYQCQSCKKQLELLVRSHETPECPECGSVELSKQFSVPAAPKASGGGSSSMPIMPSGGG